MRQIVMPAKVQPGDRVAILSPSFAAPGMFPAVHDTAMRVLRDELGLVPVEYATTRVLGASAKDRAADVTAAFADPSIAAIFATIGGDDQLTVLPHLDPDVIAGNHKPYFGYSDNTNILNWLWRIGLGSYHGGSTMVHLARGGGTHPITMASLRHALFDTNEYVMPQLTNYTDMHGDWNDASTLESEAPTIPDPGWTWHNAGHVVTAPTWGGNLEILQWNLAVDRWMLPNAEYEGCVLLLETSEEMPSATEVFRMLRNMAERQLLQQFPAIVFGKPKAWTRERPSSPDERERFCNEQREAVLEVLSAYHPSAMAVFGPDIGHTDPQVVVPYGGELRVDGIDRQVVMPGGKR